MKLTKELVATEIMGLISCDEWEEINLGSLGGPAFQKHCNHENCYSSKTTSNMFGQTIGGPPDYLHDMNHCMMVVEKFDSALISKGDYGWRVTLNNAYYFSDGSTLNEAILKAALVATGVDIE